jgi:hypothetical protein
MLNIFADALLIATRFGQLPGDNKHRARHDDYDVSHATDRDLRNWEAQRQMPSTRGSGL